MAFSGDATDFELYMLGLLEDILKELKKQNFYNGMGYGEEVKNEDVEEM